jgi:FMN-dependent NADH-azoreductase
VLGFIGIRDVDFVSAGGAAALMSGGVDRETFLQPHVDAIRTRLAA